MSMSSKSSRRFKLFRDSTIGLYYGTTLVVRGDIFDVLRALDRSCNEERAKVAKEELFDFLDATDPIEI